jgi:hypothetical protein
MESIESGLAPAHGQPPTATSKHYLVYMVTSIGMPRNHIAIFVETHESGPGTGYIYQVSGNIQQGMFHNHRPGARPEEDKDSFFLSKELLGQVSKQRYDDGEFKRVCDSIGPPPKQFDGRKKIDPNKPLRRCGEWAEDGVNKLREVALLIDTPPSD